MRHKCRPNADISLTTRDVPLATIPNMTNNEMVSLAGKVALVTGSTSGIGLGIARALAAAGTHVVLNGFGDKAQIDNSCEQVDTGRPKS